MRPWLPQGVSRYASALDRELLIALFVACALLFIAHAVVLFALTVERREQRHNIWRLELLPLLAIAVLFVWMTVRSERLWSATRYSGADPGAMQVEAVGEQFAWYFRYPGADARFGRVRPELVDAGAGNPLGLDPEDAEAKDDRVTSTLVLPVNREVDIRLRSLDVMHGFSIPAMRVKQNAVPGSVFHIHFTPTRPGLYAIQCTQVCGSGHYRMQASLRVVSQEEFERWKTAP